MTDLKGIFWQKCLAQVDYAFQPVVNIHSGICFGYEALVRNVQAAGFDAISAFFDQAHHDKVLLMVHRGLFKKATEKFRSIPWHRRVSLFYNLDNRLFGSDDYDLDAVIDALDSQDFDKGKLCFEISEQHEICRPLELTERLKAIRIKGIRIAVDDFGVGFSGLRLLYYSRPDYIKIDRFFIQHIAKDSEKRMLAGSIVSIAHQMGSIVIAEGVENEQEFYECRNIGCDMVQGYLIQRPDVDLGCLRQDHDDVRHLCERDKRNGGGKDASLIQAEIDYIQPIPCDAPATDILDAFKDDTTRTFFPIVNATNEPVGIIREASIKAFTYSRYGRFVLENQKFSNKIDELIARIPQVDMRMPIAHIMDIFSVNDCLEGLLVTNSGNYIGFLSAQSMLKILNEKKLALARDQNPLSNLPGNNCIFEYVSRTLRDTGSVYALVYFDFDNFKAYNDTYGFRQGDRVILLFSELLKAHTLSRDRFVGHVGGDDFFMGVKGVPLADVETEIRTIARQFSTNVESFYRKEAVDQGCIQARNRDGEMKCFPLMTVSSVILELPEKMHRIYSPEEIGGLIARMKKAAKQSPDKLSVASLMHFKSNQIEACATIAMETGLADRRLPADRCPARADAG
jgi:EAL domain-containing protein (putative c-di-GMP-specific phosphodiesterase class I)/GGDEF domain-containing protein